MKPIEKIIPSSVWNLFPPPQIFRCSCVARKLVEDTDEDSSIVKSVRNPSVSLLVRPQSQLFHNGSRNFSQLDNHHRESSECKKSKLTDWIMTTLTRSISSDKKVMICWWPNNGQEENLPKKNLTCRPFTKPLFSVCPSPKKKKKILFASVIYAGWIDCNR